MRKTIRRTLSLALTLAMVLSLLLVAQAADTRPVKVTLDGTALTLTSPAYVDGNQRTQVPVTIGTQLGLAVQSEPGRATFSQGARTLVFEDGNTQAGDMSMDTVPALTGAVGYVPLNYLARFFGFQLSWDSASRTAAIRSGTALTTSDITGIQAYTDQTVYGTGVVAVAVTYRAGVDLSRVTAAQYLLEDRGSLSPDFGPVQIAAVSVQGQTVTLTMDDDTAATASNKLVYTGDAKEGARERNAFGIYCTGAWYRGSDGAIYYGSADTAEYRANTTKMGYQARPCLELRLRHAGEAVSAAACLADDQGQYNARGLWAPTVDRQLGPDGFQSFENLGIRIASTAKPATDGTGDDYVRGYAYIPADYNPAAGIVFTLQGQGISYWKLPDGTDDEGTGILYDSATTSWAGKGAIVVNIHDRSSAGAGDYRNYYDFVVDDAQVMRYFIQTYGVTGPVVLQGNSRGTVASSTVIQALAGLEYTINSDSARGTSKLDKSVYDFDIDVFICQNGMFGRGIYSDADYESIARTGMKIWIFDGEQDTNNIDTYTKYTQASKAVGQSDAWIYENVRLTCYPSELYHHWGESDHSTTRINGWYFDDAAYYGPSLHLVDGAIVYDTKLQPGDTYTVNARGASRDGGMEKTSHAYTVYGEGYQAWALTAT